MRIKRSEVSNLSHLDIDCINSLNVKYTEQTSCLKELDCKMKELDSKTMYNVEEI